MPVEVVREELTEIDVLDSGVAVLVDVWVVDEPCELAEEAVEVLALAEVLDDIERLTVVELVVAVDEVVTPVVVLVLVVELTELLLAVDVEEAGARNSRIRLFPESATQTSPELSATMPEGEARLLCPVPAPPTPKPG